MTYIHVTLDGAPPVSKLHIRSTPLPAVTGPLIVLVTITFNSKNQHYNTNCDHTHLLLPNVVKLTVGLISCGQLSFPILINRIS